VEQAVLAGWSADPVHPNGHIYAKMALNLLDLIATEGQEVADEHGDWMEAGGQGSGYGGGKWSSRASKRSNNWYRKKGEKQGKNPPAHPREEAATATTMTAGARATRAANMAGPTNMMTIRVHILSSIIFFVQKKKQKKNVGPSG